MSTFMGTAPQTSPSNWPLKLAPQTKPSKTQTLNKFGDPTFAKRKRAGFDFLLSIFMVILCVIGCGVHPMKRIWQAPVILKVRLNKKGRKPTGFLYFAFDSGMVKLR